jgi:hypothetical protein
MIKKFNEYKLNEGIYRANFVWGISNLVFTAVREVLLFVPRIKSLKNKQNRENFRELENEFSETTRQAKSIGFLNDFFISDISQKNIKNITLTSDHNIIFENLESLSNLYFEEYKRIFYDDINDLLEFYHMGVPKTYKDNKRKLIERIIEFSTYRNITKEDPYGEEDWDTEEE